MTHSQQRKVIREAFSELQYLNLQDGFRNVCDRLFDMNKASERGHRRFKPEGLPPCGLSVNDAAKLFTVSHLLEGWAKPDKWTVDAILSIRNEVLYAQAYAKRFHKELTGWAEKYSEPFKQVDYAELNQAA